MITLKLLELVQPGTILAQGLVIDNPAGANPTLKRFVVTRGGIADWAVYYGPNDWPYEYIKTNGDKVYGESNIRACVDFEEGLMKYYRK